MEHIHKWTATIATGVVLAWGIMAYFVTSEDTKVRLATEQAIAHVNARVDRNDERLRNTERIVDLVNSLDKKLALVEQSTIVQLRLAESVQALREELNQLRFESQQGRNK